MLDKSLIIARNQMQTHIHTQTCAHTIWVPLVHNILRNITYTRMMHITNVTTKKKSLIQPEYSQTLLNTNTALTHKLEAFYYCPAFRSFRSFILPILSLVLLDFSVWICTIHGACVCVSESVLCKRIRFHRLEQKWGQKLEYLPQKSCYIHIYHSSCDCLLWPVLWHIHIPISNCYVLRIHLLMPINQLFILVRLRFVRPSLRSLPPPPVFPQNYRSIPFHTVRPWYIFRSLTAVLWTAYLCVHDDSLTLYVYMHILLA